MKHRCDNCESVYDEDELDEIHHYWERVDEGGVVPSGQCPDDECGCLCYPVKDATRFEGAVSEDAEGGMRVTCNGKMTGIKVQAHIGPDGRDMFVLTLTGGSKGERLPQIVAYVDGGGQWIPVKK